MHIHRAASYVNAMWLSGSCSLYANFHSLYVFLSPLLPSPPVLSSSPRLSAYFSLTVFNPPLPLCISVSFITSHLFP